MNRIIITILFFFFSFITSIASNIREKLDEAYNWVRLGDWQNAYNIVSKIDTNKIPVDSFTLKDNYNVVWYHILNQMDGESAIFDKETISRKLLYYLNEARILREQHFGVEGDYVKVMSEIVSNLIDLGEINEAEKICEIGLTRGRGLNKDKVGEINYWYGKLYESLAEIYEMKNMDKEIPSLYENAFAYSKKSNEELKHATFPLFSLALYYERKGKYQLALPIFDRMIDYAKDNKLTKDSYYAEILWFKGNAYSKAGMSKEAISTHEYVHRIAKSNNVLEIEDDEFIETESGNLIFEYLEYDGFQRIDKLVEEINSTEEYVVVVLALVVLLEERLDLDKCQLYLNKLNNDKCLSSTRGSQILRELSYLDTLKKLKSKYDKLELMGHNLKHGSEEWFSNNLGLIDCSLSLGDTLEALKQTKKRIEALEKNREEESESYIEALYLYSRLQFDKKEYIAVYDDYYKLVGLVKSKYGKESNAYYSVCSALAVCMVKKAEEGSEVRDPGIFQDLLLFVEKTYGPESPEYSIQLHNYGRWLFFQNNFKESIDALKEAKRIQIKNNGKALERTVKYLLESENSYLKEII